VRFYLARLNGDHRVVAVRLMDVLARWAEMTNKAKLSTILEIRRGDVLITSVRRPLGSTALNIFKLSGTFKPFI
jgi:hypothetical protein